MVIERDTNYMHFTTVRLLFQTEIHIRSKICWIKSPNQPYRYLDLTIEIFSKGFI